MTAIEFHILEPVLSALTTPEGWIGLLLGVGGRETISYIKSFVKQLRGTTTE